MPDDRLADDDWDYLLWYFRHGRAHPAMEARSAEPPYCWFIPRRDEPAPAVTFDLTDDRR